MEIGDRFPLQTRGEIGVEYYMEVPGISIVCGSNSAVRASITSVKIPGHNVVVEYSFLLGRLPR